MTVGATVPKAHAAEFAAIAEPHRQELLAHCYRLLGSVDEAEDMVQETYLRAWRAYDAFEHKSSARTWLYRIATNACLSTLRGSRRRVLPSAVGAPSDHVEADMDWVQPFPDALLTSALDDPAAIAASRESVRLALIVCLQHLPPRQRAVFLLREILSFSATEVASMLDTTVPAVKSTLQRARVRIAEVSPEIEAGGSLPEGEQRVLLAKFIRAFETADIAALERLLRADAALEIPPETTWFSGRSACVPALAQAVGRAGDWALLPTSANGQPAAASYTRDDGGGYRAFGLAVLTVTSTGISRIVSYADPSLATRFDLPEVLHKEVR